MNHWIRKIWGKLIPSSSEQANQDKLEVKHMPYTDAYFFTHVPKTGGTSFIVFLDRFFPAKVIFPHQLWMEIGDFSQIDKNAYHLIRGHFGGCAVDVISDKNIQYLTILRDPVKLAYSTYEYVRREKNTALHKLVMSEKMSFETFMTHPKTKHLITNRMVHNLTFGLDYDPSVKQMNLNDQPFAEFRKKMNHGQKDLTNDKRLSLSQSFLAKCLWFGVLENFDDSVRLLCYKMAWPPLRKSQKLNINKIKPVISDEARAVALSQNKLDTALYDSAVDLFNQEYQDMLRDLGAAAGTTPEQLDDLIDLHYQKNHTEKYGLQLTSGVAYDFSEILLGGQWHRREWNALNKTYFRWNGPGETSFIDFWVKPEDYLIKISVVDAINTQVVDQVKIKINDTAVPVTHVGSGKARQLQVKCHAGDIGENGLLRLTFISQNLATHTTHFSSDDNRVVGFALGAVDIEST